MVSRNYRTIGLPSLHRNGYCDDLKDNHVRAIQAFEALADSATSHITWAGVQRHLNCLRPVYTVWSQWMQHAEPLVLTLRKSGPPTGPESFQQHPHLPHCQSGGQDQRKNPFEFRQCYLTLLRYLGDLLALTGHQSSDIPRCLEDGLFPIRGFGDQKIRTLAAQYVICEEWFYDTWLPQAVAALPAYPATAEGRGHDGFLFSLLPSPPFMRRRAPDCFQQLYMVLVALSGRIAQLL